MGWDYDVTGEAVVVEVTPGKYLFALLKGAGTTEYMGSVAAASISGQRGRVIDCALFAEVAETRAGVGHYYGAGLSVSVDSDRRGYH